MSSTTSGAPSKPVACVACGLVERVWALEGQVSAEGWVRGGATHGKSTLRPPERRLQLSSKLPSTTIYKPLQPIHPTLYSQNATKGQETQPRNTISEKEAD